MTPDLSRLLRPTSIAVIGGGAWCRSVLEQLKKTRFAGDIWPVHPSGETIAGLQSFTSISALPHAPDAAFVGINRDATIAAIAELSAMGAGGAVCFASGFAEVADGQNRNADLLAAASHMPILGPNCYGFINACNGALLWPDQHGCLPHEKGVAILTQSSNIAINLTMQGRGLPISYVVTCGNQAQTSQAQIARALLDDPRVTAIGLHIEGFGDLTQWQDLARAARAKSVPLIALKVGRSAQARTATVSHTASLAGEDAGAQALLERFGIARVADLSTFLETLKLLHIAGPLASGHIASISCSGGEASLIADLAVGLPLCFPPLNARQKSDLFAALGPRVALANPLDYHTYIWRDAKAMTDAFSAMIDSDLALTLLIVDFPRNDRCDPADWECTIEAAIGARSRTGGNIAMVATLPELMPETVAARLMDGGVIALGGLHEALGAASAALVREAPDLMLDLAIAPPTKTCETMTEDRAKRALARHGVTIPAQHLSPDGHDCGTLRFPVVLKGMGFAHKTEAGAVILNLPDAAAVAKAAKIMNAQSFLIEEMVTGGMAELLLGVVKDPAHGFVLTLGAGGTLTELWQDAQSLLIPSSAAAIDACLSRLRVDHLLRGYRGKPAADRGSVIAAIMAIQDYVLANAATVEEVEVNPLICTPHAAIAADALIRIANDQPD